MFFKSLAVTLAAALVWIQDSTPPIEIPPDPGFMRADQTEAEVELPIEHKRLLEEVGTWNATLSSFSGPGMPPFVFEGQEINRMIGNAWLHSELIASPMGSNFVGIGQIGYDVEAKKALKTWIDSDSSQLSVWQGTYDLERRERIFEYTEPDDSGTLARFQVKSRVIDAERRTLDIARLGEEGEETPVLHIDYTLESR